MRFGSVCSGIEAASEAWIPLGMAPSFYSEIDPFARAVLQHHHPAVPLHGDFTTIESNTYEPVDLLAGGTPCQSFSLAGLRKGIADERGNLSLEFIRLAERLLSRGLRWLVWENVPGVLSSNGGRDFGAFLGGLAELGFGFAYRILDAQYFGVPQCRRRVVLVGYIGNWRAAAAVLFEPESLRGIVEPRYEVRYAYSPSSAISISSPVFPPIMFKVRGGSEGGGKGYLGREQQTFTISTAPDQHLYDGEYIRTLTPIEMERAQGFRDNHTDIVFKGKRATFAQRHKVLGNSWAVPKFQWLGERINMVEAML